MDEFIKYIKNIQRLSVEAEQALRSVLERRELLKGDLLVRQGQVCRDLYFLEKGCLRGYYLKDGKEVTHWFGFENDFVTSFYSLISGSPTIENLELLEDSVLIGISKRNMDVLCNDFPDIERLLRLSYESYYIRLEEKYMNQQFKTATERYQELMESRPHFLQRIPLTQIASFLGISKETLSRIRASLTGEK